MPLVAAHYLEVSITFLHQPPGPQGLGGVDRVRIEDRGNAFDVAWMISPAKRGALADRVLDATVHRCLSVPDEADRSEWASTVRTKVIQAYESKCRLSVRVSLAAIADADTPPRSTKRSTASPRCGRPQNLRSGDRSFQTGGTLDATSVRCPVVLWTCAVFAHSFVCTLSRVAVVAACRVVENPAEGTVVSWRNVSVCFVMWQKSVCL